MRKDTERFMNKPAGTQNVNRIRFSWFTLGTLFGLVIAIIVTSLSPEGVPEKTTLEPLAEFISPEPAAAPRDEYPREVRMTVKRGDTLIDMITAHKVAYEEAESAIKTLRKVYNPRRIVEGQEIVLKLDSHPEKPELATLNRLTIILSPAKSIEVSKGSEGTFTAQQVEVPTTKHYARAGGTISSSLYETGMNAGMPAGLLQEMINAYSYDIDFQRDMQPGAQIDVLFEEMKIADGTTVDYGDVLYATLSIGDKTYKIYNFTDKDGDAGYYNEKGESVRKALLKTPINGARLSSGFGMRRHPILGYSKMHKGVDFAAPTGTPIYAAGDGVVDFAGRKGGYGNYVRIRHSSTNYSTAYAHMSKFASGIRAGKRVKQGTIIGYVGTTGRSTGPHLHYEILSAGKQINPTGVKFRTGKVLKGTELANFNNAKSVIETALANTPIPRRVAMAESPETNN